MKLYDVIKKEKSNGDITKDNLTSGEGSVLISEKPTNTRIAWKKLYIIGGTALLIVVIYILGIKFVHTKVLITERQIPFLLNGQELELAYEKDQNRERPVFQSMIVSDTVTREVYGSEIKQVSSSATGKAVFYNEYSKTPQSVRAKTTLTSETGKKYQTQEMISVPGYTMSPDNKKIAGLSKEVKIQATAIGPSYNSNQITKFNVSGWSSSLSKQFYAKSVGVISGGEDGAMYVISESEKPKVLATLQAQLTERLKRETRTQIPDDLISFPELQFVSVDTDSLTLKGPSIRFPASIKGTLVTYLIPRKTLENSIASLVIQDHVYPSVSIPAISNIKVIPTTSIPTNPSIAPEVLKIKIEGQGTIITKAPLSQISDLLVGVARKDFSRVLANIGEIEKAKFTMYPFWSPLFPNKASRINIVTE